MMDKNKLQTLFIILLTLIPLTSNSQVTIGSNTPPLQGALLQLKENETTTNNSNRGLGLPRVNLTNLMPTNPTALAASMNATGSFDLNQHIGLMVYNTNHCLKNTMGITMGKGLFVWNGTQWQAIGGIAAEYDALPTATPIETSGTNMWAKAVIRHQAKVGIYEEFISADFGTAGRWMTTNLSAKAYDTNISSSTATLPTTPNGASDYTNPQWCYPSHTSPTTITEYTANKQLGLLYNYVAATAKSQNNNTANEIGVAHDNRQGICPNGWHLPSDYEWTILEREIIEQTSIYANVSKNIKIEFPDELAKVPQNTTNANGWRGLYHGTAMKEACATSSYDPVGTSKPASQGGFSVLLVGDGINNTSERFGYLTYFWASSCGGGNAGIPTAWSRGFGNSSGGVHEMYGSRNYLLPIRCKKDD